MSFVVLVASLAVIVLGAGGTAWVCFLAFQRRRRLPKAAMVLPWLIIAASVLVAIGATLAILSTVGAIGGESVDPLQRTLVVVEGISGAMRYAAIGALLWFPSTIALAAVLVLNRDANA